LHIITECIQDLVSLLAHLVNEYGGVTKHVYPSAAPDITPDYWDTLCAIFSLPCSVWQSIVCLSILLAIVLSVRFLCRFSST